MIEQLDIIWYNVVKMLKNRGHDISKVNTQSPLELIKIQYQKQLDGEHAMDIFIRGADRKCYVMFLTENDFDPKNKKDYGFMHRHTEILTQSHYLGEQDEIIFVILKEDIETEKLYVIEEADPRVSVFHYKRLLFDLSEHQFVPTHEKIDESEKKLIKRKLSLQTWNQLPALEKSDAVCRYYGYRRGDIIKITRPTYASGPHVVYRVVI